MVDGEGVQGLGRIGFLGQGWSPDAGGIEVHTAALAASFIEQGIKVSALAFGAESPGPQVTKQVGVRVTRVQRPASGLSALEGDLASDEALSSWLDDCRPELVHVHHLSGWGTRALDVLRERRVPVVVSLHDDWLICPRGQRWHSSNFLCAKPDPATCAQCLAHSHPDLGMTTDGVAQRLTDTRRTLAGVDRILAPSASLLEAHQRAGVQCAGLQELGEVLPLGIDAAQLELQTNHFRTSRGKDDSYRLGVLGSLQPSKGVLHLAKAVLAAGRPDLVLEIHGPRTAYHGDGETVKQLEALAQEHGAIRLHPGFSPSRRAEVLAMLDGIAVPSLWEEGFGLAAREARAVGLPVVASSIGGLNQLKGDPGVLLVPAGDHVAWTEAVAQLEKGLIAPLEPMKNTCEMAAEVVEVYRRVLEQHAMRAA